MLPQTSHFSHPKQDGKRVMIITFFIHVAPFFVQFDFFRAKPPQLALKNRRKYVFLLRVASLRLPWAFEALDGMATPPTS